MDSVPANGVDGNKSERVELAIRFIGIWSARLTVGRPSQMDANEFGEFGRVLIYVYYIHYTSRNASDFNVLSLGIIWDIDNAVASTGKMAIGKDAPHTLSIGGALVEPFLIEIVNSRAGRPNGVAVLARLSELAFATKWQGKTKKEERKNFFIMVIFGMFFVEENWIE